MCMYTAQSQLPSVRLCLQYSTAPRMRIARRRVRPVSCHAWYQCPHATRASSSDLIETLPQSDSLAIGASWPALANKVCRHLHLRLPLVLLLLCHDATLCTHNAPHPPHTLMMVVAQSGLCRIAPQPMARDRGHKRARETPCGTSPSLAALRLARRARTGASPSPPRSPTVDMRPTRHSGSFGGACVALTRRALPGWAAGTTPVARCADCEHP